MKRLGLVAVVGLLALAGCGDTPAGTIVEKEHESSKTSVTTTCSGTGTNRKCTPKPHPKPACWELEIREDNGDVGEFCVDKKEWDKWNVGDRYPGSASR